MLPTFKSCINPCEVSLFEFCMVGLKPSLFSVLLVFLKQHQLSYFRYRQSNLSYKDHHRILLFQQYLTQNQEFQFQTLRHNRRLNRPPFS